MTNITFTIPGPPQGKARPRVVRTKYGRSMSFTPDKTVAYEELVRARYAVAPHPEVPLQGPVCVSIVASYPIPASTSKKRHAEMLAGMDYPAKKPDWDNIGKIICDALNGIAYRDDAQVIFAQVEKRYAEFPCVKVRIWEVHNDARS